MTPEQINAALAKLGLSPKEAGRLFRHDEPVFRWKAGDRGIPQGIAILLHLMLDGKISKADVAAATAVVFD
jgi:hypothetical protein